MRKMLIVSNGCLECVFYQKKCVLGHRRPWNSLTCDDYRPYCLVCPYPKVFCNTCRNRASCNMKPLEVDIKENILRSRPVDYACVWSPPQVMQQ